MEEYRFAKHKELVAVLCSINCSQHFSDTGSKESKRFSRENKYACPTYIDDYNNYMGGVDLVDQNVSYYTKEDH